ncbi:MAG: glycosyltransferase family 1 protein [Rickettsiales bacterium TMED254]|nr:MAG: glycosyltransferase family 1 protein [Rickettsiales bacterium TMED254]
MSLQVSNSNPDEFKLKQEPKGPTKDGTYKESFGGTELMNKALHERVDKDLLEQFNIIKSRVREVSDDKPNILWLHDLWNDPENQHLADVEKRKRFDRLVFVSNYQMNTYQMAYNIAFNETFVLKNAIEPIIIPEKAKDGEQIRIIYHTTPHRGLNIAVAGVAKLAETLKDKIHFDVYSSFNAYGWPHRDEPYKEIFKQVEEHPNMTYHGFQPNDVVRKALESAHIFAYPSIWTETSCIAAIEAMSAGCQIVCPNLGALPETTGGFATMYHYHEDIQTHANIFVNFLQSAINNHRSEDIGRKLLFQKNWVDNFYNWDLRANEWTGMLQGVQNLRKQKEDVAERE